MVLGSRAEAEFESAWPSITDAHSKQAAAQVAQQQHRAMAADLAAVERQAAADRAAAFHVNSSAAARRYNDEFKMSSIDLTMSLFPSGSQLLLTIVPGRTTGRDLKELLHRTDPSWGWPEDQSCSFAGKCLDDTRLLWDYGLRPGATIHVLPMLRKTRSCCHK